MAYVHGRDAHVREIVERALDRDSLGSNTVARLNLQLTQRRHGVALDEQARRHTGQCFQFVGEALVEHLARRNRPDSQSPAIERRFKSFECRDCVLVAAKEGIAQRFRGIEEIGYRTLDTVGFLLILALSTLAQPFRLGDDRFESLRRTLGKLGGFHEDAIGMGRKLHLAILAGAVGQ